MPHEDHDDGVAGPMAILSRTARGVSSGRLRTVLACARRWLAQLAMEKALPGRLELLTLRLTASRSSQLSYGSSSDVDDLLRFSFHSFHGWPLRVL